MISKKKVIDFIISSFFSSFSWQLWKMGYLAYLFLLSALRTIHRRLLVHGGISFYISYLHLMLYDCLIISILLIRSITMSIGLLYLQLISISIRKFSSWAWQRKCTDGQIDQLLLHSAELPHAYLINQQLKHFLYFSCRLFWKELEKQMLVLYPPSIMLFLVVINQIFEHHCHFVLIFLYTFQKSFQDS